MADKSSENAKTGAMAQAWILRQDMHPVLAAQSGADASICGDCPLRPTLADGGPTCYVNKAFGPAASWRAARKDDATVAPAQVGHAARERGRGIRVGAYGDPAAVPLSVWREILAEQPAHTGYTHQWRNPKCDPGFAEILMASVGTAEEARQAQAAGWRTFRVRRADEPLMPNEISCPASAESGHRTQCADCGLCDGRRAGKDLRKSIAIIDHGPTARKRKA